MAKDHSLFDRDIIGPALADSFRKLSPAKMVKNPVMFVTEVGDAFTTLDFLNTALRG